MIYIDDSNLIQRAVDSDQAFHVDVRATNIKSVFLNGEQIRDAFYVDLEKGFLIRIKTDIECRPVVISGELAHEILFGDVNPSGKLPFVIPYKEKDLPIVNWDTSYQWYDYYHGYAKLETLRLAGCRHCNGENR